VDQDCAGKAHLKNAPTNTDYIESEFACLDTALSISNCGMDGAMGNQAACSGGAWRGAHRQELREHKRRKRQDATIGAVELTVLEEGDGDAMPIRSIPIELREKVIRGCLRNFKEEIVQPQAEAAALQVTTSRKRKRDIADAATRALRKKAENYHLYVNFVDLERQIASLLTRSF